jgi:hypothetical protein
MTTTMPATPLGAQFQIMRECAESPDQYRRRLKPSIEPDAHKSLTAMRFFEVANCDLNAPAFLPTPLSGKRFASGHAPFPRVELPCELCVGVKH